MLVIPNAGPPPRDAHSVAERTRWVDEALHSLAMPGFDVTSETLEGAAEFIAGDITSDELVTRARARYGLAP